MANKIVSFGGKCPQCGCEDLCTDGPVLTKALSKAKVGSAKFSLNPTGQLGKYLTEERYISPGWCGWKSVFKMSDGIAYSIKIRTAEGAATHYTLKTSAEWEAYVRGSFSLSGFLYWYLGDYFKDALPSGYTNDTEIDARWNPGGSGADGCYIKNGFWRTSSGHAITADRIGWTGGIKAHNIDEYVARRTGSGAPEWYRCRFAQNSNLDPASDPSHWNLITSPPSNIASIFINTFIVNAYVETQRNFFIGDLVYVCTPNVSETDDKWSFNIVEITKDVLNLNTAPSGSPWLGNVLGSIAKPSSNYAWRWRTFAASWYAELKAGVWTLRDGVYGTLPMIGVVPLPAGAIINTGPQSVYRALQAFTDLTAITLTDIADVTKFEPMQIDRYVFEDRGKMPTYSSIECPETPNLPKSTPDRWGQFTEVADVTLIEPISGSPVGSKSFIGDFTWYDVDNIARWIASGSYGDCNNDYLPNSITPLSLHNTGGVYDTATHSWTTPPTLTGNQFRPGDFFTYVATPSEKWVCIKNQYSDLSFPPIEADFSHGGQYFIRVAATDSVSFTTSKYRGPYAVPTIPLTGTVGRVVTNAVGFKLFDIADTQMRTFFRSRVKWYDDVIIINGVQSVIIVADHLLICENEQTFSLAAILPSDAALAATWAAALAGFGGIAGGALGLSGSRLLGPGDLQPGGVSGSLYLDTAADGGYQMSVASQQMFHDYCMTKRPCSGVLECTQGYATCDSPTNATLPIQASFTPPVTYILNAGCSCV